VTRPTEEWIVVSEACPRIIDEDTWQRVQDIINDPERTKHLPTPQVYMLRGRAKCGICGSAMVGQTLKVKGRAYGYYRCRHVYDKNTSRTCTARYVRGDKLETAVWAEVERVLSSPAIVLKELENQSSDSVDITRIAGVEGAIKALAAREERLVKLYGLGTVNEQVIQGQLEEISRERIGLVQQLNTLQRPVEYDTRLVDQDTLERVCAGVTQWLGKADDSEKIMALEALQVSVEATTTTATVTGILPLEAPEFIKSEQSCRCLFSGEYKPWV